MCLQAIDVWNNICVSFVFLALLEYALVNYAARADARYTLSLISFWDLHFIQDSGKYRYININYNYNYNYNSI